MYVVVGGNATFEVGGSGHTRPVQTPAQLGCCGTMNHSDGSCTTPKSPCFEPPNMQVETLRARPVLNMASAIELKKSWLMHIPRLA